MEPVDTWSRSILSSTSLEIRMASSSSYPPGTYSSALMRSSMGKPGPTAARTASSTSSKKRQRFSVEPPYSSVRLLTAGERNWLKSQPWPAWIITISNSARLARPAAVPKAAAISWIRDWGISCTWLPLGSTSAEGPYLGGCLLALSTVSTAEKRPP